MRYALLIYGNLDEIGRLSEDEARQLNAGFAEIDALPDVSGNLRLRMPDQAITFRFQQGNPLTTDGPFVESKEFLGGIIFVDSADLEGARAVAAEIQKRRLATGIEIRPVNEDALQRA